MQNQIILSLGSNIGDRKQNICDAINCIHQSIGTVLKVSHLYETPAWGFSSKAFLNMVLLMESCLPAEEVLAKVINIENILGRVRTTSNTYEARTIDIDIIDFNGEVYSSKNLQLPHPLMHLRLFVLKPMLDLDIEYKHPTFKIFLQELIANTDDASEIKFYENLKSPLSKINLQKFNYIAIEGNIGAGKTTLANKIANHFNAKTVLERFADNPFLPKFYEDQTRFAFPLEMSFLADRYKQLSDDLAQFELFSDFVMADYHIFKSLVFAKITLQEDEYRLFKTMFDIIYKDMQKPDLYIFLYQNTDRLLKNIKKRGRDYEQNIKADYLEKITQGYLDYIKKQENLNVLVIDVSTLDFVRSHQDYLFILDEIAEKCR